MNINKKNFDFNNFEKSFENIDLFFIFNFLFRNKKLITACSIIFFLFGAIVSLNLKKVWQGEFEIVIDSKQESLPLPVGLLNSFQLPGRESNTLITEVGILKSPLILLPVFNYVKNLDITKYNNYKYLEFSDWKKNYLNIGLKKKTSILTITYEDNNKDVILPVLNKISTAYQSYSGMNRRRGIQLAKNYLVDQISLYKDKSSKSFKSVQEFADEQDLITTNLEARLGLDSENKKLSPIENISNLNLEVLRARSANEIKKIDEQIINIKNLEDNLEELQYIGSTIPGIQNTGLPGFLEQTEGELFELSSKFTESDSKIIDLKNKRKIYTKLLIKRSIGYLEAKKLELNAVIKSTLRPKGVFLKYKELLREAERDEKTLIKLENELGLLNLDEARINDPWQLITNPTVRKNPVAPDKKKISFIALMLGFFIGVIWSIYKEIQSDSIFEDKSIEKFFNTKIIERYNFKLGNFLINKKFVFINEILNIESNVKFFISDDIETKNYEKFFKNILEISDKNTYSNDLNLFKKSDNIILLLPSKNKLTYDKISKIRDRLSILEFNLFGIVIIEEN